MGYKSERSSLWDLRATAVSWKEAQEALAGSRDKRWCLGPYVSGAAGHEAQTPRGKHDLQSELKNMSVVIKVIALVFIDRKKQQQH